MALKKSKNRASGAHGYAEYLRGYYEDLRDGKEKCPSNAELRVFMRQLMRVVEGNTECDEYLEEAPVKLRA